MNVTDDTDLFSDDGLDDLPEDTLQALENGLLLAGHTAIVAAVDAADDDLAFEDDDIDTTEVINELLAPVGRPTTHPHPHPLPLPYSHARPPPHAVPPAAGSAATHPVPLPSRPHAHVYAAPRGATTTAGAPAEQPPALLRQQLGALEQALRAARGEVAILRSNSARAERSHADEVAALRRDRAAQLAEHERQLQAAAAAERSAVTELQFLRQDLRESSSRAVRAVARPPQAPTAAPAGLPTTPRKSARSWAAIADGFDDLEMMATSAAAASPGGRARPDRTPSRAKRKRPAGDSPLLALEMQADSEKQTVARRGRAPVLAPAWSAPAQAVEVWMAIFSLLLWIDRVSGRVADEGGDGHQFLQFILHHAADGHPPTVDVLCRFEFPSDGTTSLGQLILQRLPLMGDPQRPMQLLVDFAEVLIGLWGRCYDESLLEPVWYLVDLIGFVLQLNVAAVAPLLIRHLVPIAVATVCVVAERVPGGPKAGPTPSAASALLPRNSSSSGDSSAPVGDDDDGAPIPGLASVDATQVLSLLNLVALACAAAPSGGGGDSARAAFWRLVPLDFVGLLLAPHQRVDDVVAALALLSTAVLPASLGPLVPGRPADVVARLVIDRVSARLTDAPRSPAVPPRSRHRVRLAALRALIAFASSPFGAAQLAAHDTAAPRLVTLLSASIDALYDLPLSPHLYGRGGRACASGSADTDTVMDEDEDEDEAAGLYATIATATRLLHGLVMADGGGGAAAGAIAAAHGGPQRYTVALARLNFADEDGLVEAGVGVETMQLAHELLELASTPDEGERMTRAFVPAD